MCEIELQCVRSNSTFNVLDRTLMYETEFDVWDRICDEVAIRRWPC